MLVLEEEFFFCYRIDNVTNAMTMLFFAYKDMLSIAKGIWKLIGPCSGYKLLEKSLWYTTLYTSSCYKGFRQTMSSAHCYGMGKRRQCYAAMIKVALYK